jgi:hypothetical protein
MRCGQGPTRHDMRGLLAERSPCGSVASSGIPGHSSSSSPERKASILPTPVWRAYHPGESLMLRFSMTFLRFKIAQERRAPLSVMPCVTTAGVEAAIVRRASSLSQDSFQHTPGVEGRTGGARAEREGGGHILSEKKMHLY